MNADLQKADHLFTVKRYQEALKYCRAALAADPENEQALYIAGFCGLMENDAQTAEEMGRALLRSQPDSPCGHEILGHLAVEAKNRRGAEVHFRATLKAQPEDPHYFALMSQFLGSQGRLEEGITVARKGLALDPDDPELLHSLQKLYWLNDEPEQAEEFGRRALAADPERSGVHLQAGLILLEKDRRGEARGRFLESLRLDPASGNAKDVMASERVRSHPMFRHGLFLPTSRGAVIAAVIAPLAWYALSLLFEPLVYLAYVALAVVIGGYGYLGLYHLCVWITARRIRAGKA